MQKLIPFLSGEECVVPIGKSRVLEVQLSHLAIRDFDFGGVVDQGLTSPVFVRLPLNHSLITPKSYATLPKQHESVQILVTL